MFNQNQPGSGGNQLQKSIEGLATSLAVMGAFGSVQNLSHILFWLVVWIMV